MIDVRNSNNYKKRYFFLILVYKANQNHKKQAKKYIKKFYKMSKSKVNFSKFCVVKKQCIRSFKVQFLYQ